MSYVYFLIGFGCGIAVMALTEWAARHRHDV